MAALRQLGTYVPRIFLLCMIVYVMSNMGRFTRPVQQGEVFYQTYEPLADKGDQGAVVRAGGGGLAGVKEEGGKGGATPEEDGGSSKRKKKVRKGKRKKRRREAEEAADPEAGAAEDGLLPADKEEAVSRP